MGLRAVTPKVARLPKGDDVNSASDLTVRPALGLFYWLGCALFESDRVQGGCNRA